MLFKELTFHNFLSFYGANQILFPDPLKERSALILILAPNNSGKTNIIRGLSFLLHADQLNFSGKPDRLINERARAELSVDKEIEGYVAATILKGDEFIRVRRRIRARKLPGGHFKTTEFVLEKEVNKDIWVTSDADSIQRHLNLLVPESLFGYFYLKGEELAQQVSAGNPRIRQGLDILLHLNRWKLAKESVDRQESSYSSQLSKLVSKNKEFQEANDALARALAEHKRQKSSLAELEEQQGNLVASYSAVTSEIHKMNKGENVQKIAAAQSKLHEDERRIGQALATSFNDLVHSIGASKGVPFLFSAFEPGQRLLADMKSDNLLPADVTLGLVERLLSSLDAKCICGRCLSEPDHEEARNHLKAFAEKALASHINEALLSLLNNLEENVSTGFAKQTERSVADIKGHIDQHERLKKRYAELKSEEEDLANRLSQFPQDEITRKLVEQAKIVRERDKVAADLQQARNNVRMIESRLPQLRSRLEGLQQGNEQKLVIKLNKKRDVAVKLSEMIDDSIRLLRRDFCKILQSDLADYYDGVVTDGSAARIDPVSLLPSIYTGGQVQHNLGGGQSQLLTLSYVVALAKLRKKLHDDLDSCGIRLGSLDDQSFFMDSIFAPTEQAYAGEIAKFLPNKARQMVVLLASQQWTDAVHSALEKHVTTAFQFLLHSPKPDGTQVKWKGKTVVLDCKSDEVFTTIKEIK